MFIEPLEDRIAPASVVALTLTGTALKVTLSSPEQLSVFPDPVSGLDILGSNGATFTLNGSPLSPIQGFPAAVSLSGHNIGSISFVDANPADTNDAISIGAPIHGNVAISLAGTLNTVNVETPQISGGLSVKTPAGGTLVNIMAPITGGTMTLIGGPVKLALGLAGSQVSITATALEIDGSFSDVAGPTKLTGSPGPNSFTVDTNGTGFLKVAGALTFSSKFAPSHFSISVPSLAIGGNLSILETGSASSSANFEGLSGNSATIGGNLTINANSAQPISFTEPFMIVSGKITVLEAGAGNVTIQSTQVLESAALSVKANGGNLTLFGPITNSTSGPFVGGIEIGGGVKLSGLAGVTFAGTGIIGGNFSASNVSNLLIDFGITPSPTAGRLEIGGSLSLAAPIPQAGGFVPTNSMQIGDVVVGGSLKVTGNSAGGIYALTDSSIFGSASFNIGSKVNAPGQLLTITETGGDHQMFIGGAFSASLGPQGAVTFSDANVTPDLLVYGQATFTEPTINSLTLTIPSNLFALPIKIATTP